MPAVTSLRFGVSQGHGGGSLVEGANGFVTSLGKMLDLTVRLIVAPDYEKLLAAITGGGLDVAWMPPLLHVRATAARASLVGVCERNGARTYRSALLVRADSRATSVKDLAGARVAWTDRASSGGYIFPRLHLLAAGIAPGKGISNEKFVGSPRAACAAVADGNADLCACFISEEGAKDAARALEDVKRVYPPAPWRLKVLDVTEAIPPDGVVLAETVPADVARRITEALHDLHKLAEGREALQKLMYADKLVPVDVIVARALARLAQLV
jgi:phosphonate transport system substrate-binding protein